MKKKALSLALALVMCLGLTVPVLAVETTTIKDDAGYSYTLSQPVIGSYVTKDNNAKDVTVYQIPEGTIITPISPEGKEYDRTSLKNLGFGLGHMMEKEQGLKQAGADVDPDRAERTTNFFVVYEEVEPDDSGNMHALHGLWYDYSEGGEEVETQPFPVGEYLIRREIRWIYAGSSEGGSTIPPTLGTGGDSYLRVKIMPKDGSTDVTDPGTTTPTEPQQPATKTANPTNDKLAVNGAAVDPTVYKIDGSNYFKIRDVAAVLNGTEKQFAVGYDGATRSVTATTGQGYDKQPGDLAGAPAGGSQSAASSNDAIYVNGEKITAEVYKIGGSNYFKLRDLGKALNFYVGWTAEQGMFIETDKPYSE